MIASASRDEEVPIKNKKQELCHKQWDQFMFILRKYKYPQKCKMEKCLFRVMQSKNVKIVLFVFSKGLKMNKKEAGMATQLREANLSSVVRLR